MKARIIKVTKPNRDIEYTIQQRHHLFRWWWVNAWVNGDPSTRDTWPTLKEAQDNLCWFDGTKWTETVLTEKK